VELREMGRFRIAGMHPTLLKFPDLGGPARYLREHLRAGDVVLGNNMYQIRHLMGRFGQASGPMDFMPTTGSLFLPATLADHGNQILDRRDGARFLPSPESLVDLFARHPRVWYIVHPGQNSIFNSSTTSSFLRQHMEVVYEDYDTLVL